MIHDDDLVHVVWFNYVSHDRDHHMDPGRLNSRVQLNIIKNI